MLDTATIKELGRLAVALSGFGTIVFIGYRLLFAAKKQDKIEMHFKSVCYGFTISGVNSGIICVVLASVLLVVWLLAG